MAFFQTVMDSWRMRGLSGEERDALASLLRGLMVADGDFADSELRELGRLGGKAGEAGDAEIRKTTAALMADPEKSPIVYDLLADTVVADELFTRDERDYLDSLKDLGFDPIRFEAALGARARARAHPDLREIGTTRLPNLAAAHAEILRRFSGALDTWRRAAGAVGAWFGRSPSKEAAVALCGNPAADTAALNRLFAHVGAEFVWHGQIVGHLVFEIRITDPAVLDDALRRAPEPSPRREDLVIEPFFTQEDRQRLQRATAEYGLEWVEYPMLSSDLSSLVAEADFRFFGGQLGRCFKVDIRRVIDQIIAQRNCARVVDALRRMAIEFGKDLHNNLDNLIATVSAGESKRFYIAHDLFWAHLNTLIRRLVGLDGVPVRTGFLLSENLQDVLDDRMDPLGHAVFLYPVVIGGHAIHNVIFGPVLGVSDLSESFLGRELRCRLVRYDADDDTRSLIERSCFDPRRGTIFLDETQCNDPVVEAHGLRFVAADADACASRSHASILFHEMAHVFFHETVRAQEDGRVSIDDRDPVPADAAVIVCSEAWARLATLAAFPDLGIAVVGEFDQMLESTQDYKKCARWILRRLRIKSRDYVTDGQFDQARFETRLRELALNLITELASEMAAHGWILDGFPPQAGLITAYGDDKDAPAPRVQWGLEPDNTGAKRLAASGGRDTI